MRVHDLDATHYLDKMHIVEQEIVGIDDYMGIGGNAWAVEFYLAYTGEWL